MPYISYRYKLRSGGPVSMGGGEFYVHTFMAEEKQVTSFEATPCLLATEDMAGQFDSSGNAGEYESATYSALQYTSADGTLMFQGEEIKKPVYIEEEDIGRSGATFIDNG